LIDTVGLQYTRWVDQSLTKSGTWSCDQWRHVATTM